jgi:uncharacterized repeat protein (TIGR04076 family)
MHLIVTIKEIKGSCAVYKVGDTFRFEDGYRLVSDIPVCMHSLASIMPFYNALRVAEPNEFGLACRDDASKACLQCLDPCEYSGGGTVIMEISRAG